VSSRSIESAVAEPTEWERTSGRSSLRRELLRGPLRRIDPAIAALTILGFALASHRLGAKSLRLDEAISADHARLGLRGLLSVISSRDPNMGLYYALLHYWVRIFGYSEAAVRSMTVVLAGLAVPAMVLLGRRLFGRAVGLVAGLLLALGPFFVQFEQTARSYALVVLLVVLSSYFFVSNVEKPSRGARVGYVLASALAIYTHYFAAYVLLVQLVTLLAIKRDGAFRREWLTTELAVAVLCAPEAVIALRAGTGYVSWIPEPTLSSLVKLPSHLAGGILLAAILAILACYGFARAIADRQKWQAGFVAAWLLVPVILDFAVSKFGRPLFVTYYLIVVLPAFLLLAAVGVAKLRRRAAALIVLALLVALSALGIDHWYTHHSLEDFRGATRYILKNERRDDGIVYYPPGTLGGPASGIAYYEALAGTSGPTPVQFQLGRAPLARTPRIWLVMRNPDVSAAGPRRQREVESSISGAYGQVGRQADFHNITVILYRVKNGNGRAVSSARP
jgi:mannosyltransferase